MTSDRAPDRRKGASSGGAKPRAGLVCGVLAAGLLSACANVSLPPIEPSAQPKLTGEHSAATATKNTTEPAAAHPPHVPSASGATSDLETIIGFKGAAVVMYHSVDSNNGEKIEARALSLPMQARKSAAAAGRLEVSTVNGPRWISRSDVVVAASGAEPPH